MPGHRLAGRSSIALNDLDGSTLIGFDSDLTIRREIDRVLAQHHIEVRVAMEFDNIETIKRAIEIDSGVSILPAPTVEREVAAGSLVAIPIDGDELVRPIGIITRRGKELGVTIRRFIDLIRADSGPDVGVDENATKHDEVRFTENHVANGESDATAPASAADLVGAAS
ncbi:MAG: LysR family transcriptional regulator substrate-binding protein [Pirellulales bacterium]